MNKDRYLLVVSGPAGCGKDTVVSKMIEKHPGIELSVSATTRPMRGYEEEGVHYFFLATETFERYIADKELVEWTRYVGNYYGTLRSQLEERMKKGITCVLVVEVQGAANIKKQYPDCTTVFIMPPNIDELERRLRCRGTESEEKVQRRLARAQEEIALKDDYDFQLMNDDANLCAEELYTILQLRQNEE